MGDQVSELPFVGRMEQPGLGRGCNTNALKPQPCGYPSVSHFRRALLAFAA